MGLAAVLVAVLSAALFARKEYRRSVQEAEKRLSTLAEERRRLAGHLLEEARKDLETLRSYPTLKVLVEGQAPSPSKAPSPRGEGPRAHLEALLGAFIRIRGYEGAYLLDGRGATMAASPGAPPLPEACRAWLRDPLQREVSCRFFPRPEGGAWLVYAAPAGLAKAGQATPYLLLLEDPRRRLFPLILPLPHPSATEEILLADREGDRIRYLTPLRFSSAPPLSLSVPFQRQGLAAREAFVAGAAFGRFTDYRGREVFAAVRQLAGPRWALVVKADEEEVLGPFRAELLLGFAFAAILLAFLAATGAAFLRRKRLLAALGEREAALRHETELSRLNRFYRTLSRVNETLVHAAEPEALLRDVCRVLVETGGFSLAWVGEAEEGGRVAIRAGAGEAADYLKELSVRCDDAPEGRGPCGTAFREGRAVYIADWAEDPRSAPWREKGLSYGIRSCASFPMRHAGKIWGILTLYAAERDAFDEERLRLGQELADDVAFALRSLEDRGNLLQIQERLLEAQKLETIGLIAGGVAHEVRNPLFALQTLVAGLERKLSGRGDLSEFFGHMKDQVERLNALMTDLLQLGRPIAKEDFAEVDLREVVERAVGNLAPRFAGIEEKVSVEGEAPRVRGVRANLLQVAENLVSNALSFTPEGERVAVSLRAEGGEAVVEVRDRGPGIPRELLGKLFTPFASKRKGGTGLGLAIVRKIVEAHGGTVEARNNDPPPGACFTVRLPAP